MESTTINFFGYDLVQIIQAGGLVVLCGIVFAETGLFVGCFLPGDSLLVAAGFVASMFPDKLSIGHVLVLVPLAAVCGDHLNYYIGRTAGAALYKRESTRFFRRDHLLQTRDFVDKYGPAGLIMARFVPFARSFAPAVVGIAEMPY
ncbi:MAG: VTT domain-containing protein, partial [Armatimonadetes bacterium]|nr:VTT domain-containing protein [Armatimonadota bacterium]